MKWVVLVVGAAIHVLVTETPGWRNVMGWLTGLLTGLIFAVMS